MTDDQGSTSPMTPRAGDATQVAKDGQLGSLSDSQPCNAAPITECPKYGGKVCVAEAGALCECYPGGLEYRKGLGIPTQAERDADAAKRSET